VRFTFVSSVIMLIYLKQLVLSNQCEREKNFYRIDTWKNQVWVKGTYKLVFIVNSLSQGTGTVAKKFP
jgi:hypothetical protein